MAGQSVSETLSDGDAALPLAGLKVLEFTQTIMGPCAGLVLADLGADVVKIEPAPRGDNTRRLPGFASADYVEGRTAFMHKRKPQFRGR